MMSRNKYGGKERDGERDDGGGKNERRRVLKGGTENRRTDREREGERGDRMGLPKKRKETLIFQTIYLYTSTLSAPPETGTPASAA